MGFTMGTKQLVITPMRILVRLVPNRTFLETISRFSATPSAISCTFLYITGDTARAVSHEYVLQCVCCRVCVAVCVLQCVCCSVCVAVCVLQCVLTMQGCHCIQPIADRVGLNLEIIFKTF